MSDDADKSGAYATTGDSASDSLEKMSRKIANEVRYRVRRFTHTDPYSAAWLELIEPLKFLCAIAQKEEDVVATAAANSSTAPAGPTQQVGAAGKADSTVWEREEVTIRIVVEEGKVNLMARCLREFKELQYRAAACPPELVQHGKVYEVSLGGLVKCSLATIECLQTLDLRSMLEHCAIVLSHAVSDKCTGMDPTSIVLQEFVVVHYLAAIGSKVERLQPDVLVAKMEELDLFELVGKHLAKFKTIYDRNLIASVVNFLATVADTEYFRSKHATLFPTKEAKKAFAQRYDPVVSEYLQVYPDRKKAVRPLTDLIVRWK